MTVKAGMEQRELEQAWTPWLGKHTIYSQRMKINEFQAYKK